MNLRTSVGGSCIGMGPIVAMAVLQLAGRFGGADGFLEQTDAIAGSIRQVAYARIEAALKIAADQKLVEAVVEKNKAPESMAEIRSRDDDWVKNPTFPLRSELTHNECSARLRELVVGDPVIVGAKLIDGNGTVVCSTIETSDYWQGDEDKWKKTYVEGSRFFVDAPAFNLSAGTYAVQLSVPVQKDGQRIGALTLTLRIPEERWGVPQHARALVNPVAPSREALERGGALFGRYCKSCHGPKGAGDGPEAKRSFDLPRNLTDPIRQQRLSDGEIFWKMSAGHKLGAEVVMPGFASRMSVDDRWKVVRFVRTLASAAPTNEQ